MTKKTRKTHKMRKVLLTVCCAALLVCVTIGATVAYLTATDEVVNTFTVGNVQIKLDEAKANADGTLYDNGNTRVDANSYKLLPGHPYNKDPMVTVLKDSEACYVKMTMTISKSAELDLIFDKVDGHADMLSIFTGYDANTWLCKGNTEDTNANTRTYEFWYKEAVEPSTADRALKPLFEKVVVPGFITNAQLATIKGMTITVNAYAIQKDGFDTADAAWTAFDQQA